MLPSLLVSLAVIAVSPGGTAGQECLPADAVVENLYGFAVQVAAGEGDPWSDVRTTHDLPETGEEDVEIVTAHAVCGAAGREYGGSSI